MKNIEYKYVIFNSVESKFTFNPNGYYAICYNDLRQCEQILCVDMPLQGYPKVFRYLYNLHHSARLNSLFKLPLKKIWYPFYFKSNLKKKDKVCFVLQIRLPIQYLAYLKTKYPESRFVSIYRDLRRVTEVNNPDYPDNPIFDLQMTIDKKEAKKYGWIHFDEIESKIKVPVASNYPLHDVFFAGKAKDRLPRLLEAYSILTNAGVNCYYYLTDVPDKEKVELPGVMYANGFMQYSEMLYHTVNSKCVLEINQKEAVGYTSRFLEAVMYNKRLITDNQDVRESKFFNPENILCISNISDISPSFVLNDNKVDYKYNNEFAPIHLIEKIDQELKERYE